MIDVLHAITSKMRLLIKWGYFSTRFLNKNKIPG